ncbi:MAG: cation-translocating P-type ATPase [Alphaproteobacteria bacterium]|nr:cation-translocating P-type ATPase [Alphaproteobacteria bacterium]
MGGSTTQVPHGLTHAEARARLERDGPNALPEQRTDVLGMVAEQLRSVFVWMLVGAMAISIAIPVLEHGRPAAADLVDAIVIGVILVLNTLLGVAQAFRAERAIAELARMAASAATVVRDGQPTSVDAREVVVGDVLLLGEGDRVAADGEVAMEAGLAVDASMLTGESVPVEKNAGDIVEMGTLVTAGSGTLVVTATGARTEVGRLAGMLTTTRPPPTPLELQLQVLARWLAWVALAAVGGVMAVGIARGLPVGELLLVAISLGVSMVPEGLPAVVTVSFALGARRMVAARALVRRLDALETLGSVSVLCTDKTGTLTANRMTVVDTWTPTPADAELLQSLAGSCNHASDPSHGDPTETALLGFALERGAARLPIDDEPVPFASERKYMATRHGDRTFYKGAPEVLAGLAVPCPGLLDEAARMASEGRRVLAAGVQDADGPVRLVGLFALEDPPREGAAEAVARAASAGVRTVMITGDHPGTARAIAARTGISGGSVVTGEELDALDDERLSEVVAEASVFARVSPAHKVRICRALQSRGAVVAMTGDGVNDAPALKAAHVGVAMGLRGTEVAREAASIVLADDHFATLVQAIAEGRRSHDNIRRFVLFLLRANFDELLLVLVVFAVGLPVPLLPVHILWINLLTDGLPALALTAEPAEPDIMERPPRPVDEQLLSGEYVGLVVAMFAGAAGALLVFLGTLRTSGSIDVARTATLTFAVLLELAMAFSARTRAPAWSKPLRESPWLVGATGLVLAVHVLVMVTPAAGVLRLTPLPLAVWPVLAGVVAAVFLVLEATKALRRT